jgi:3-deoxy-manno-octulosonate cytidylyltransferase (CMP-KDO synthetase)
LKTTVCAEPLLVKVDCNNGTERCYYAARRLERTGDKDIIINIQGDNVIFDPAIIERMLFCMQYYEFDLVTAITTLSYAKLHDPNLVKAIVYLDSFEGCEDLFKVKDFSRFPFRDPEVNFQHVGIYAYRFPTLHWYMEQEISRREGSLSLEQMRFVDAGKLIGAIYTDKPYCSINVPEDIEEAECFLKGR